MLDPIFISPIFCLLLSFCFSWTRPSTSLLFSTPDPSAIFNYYQKSLTPKSPSLQYDVFISHASLDKDEIALPLAKALENRGLQVWLDKEQLQVGDSIRREIDTALRQSRFCLVVLSPAYLDSEWAQKELDAFFAKEKHNAKAILPLHHGVSIAFVEQHWLMLADKISLNTTESIEQLANKIQQSVKSDPSKPARIPVWHSTSSPSSSGAVNIASGRYTYWLTLVDKEGIEVYRKPREENDGFKANSELLSRYKENIGCIAKEIHGGKEYEYRVTDVDSRYLENGNFLIDVRGKCVGA